MQHTSLRVGKAQEKIRQEYNKQSVAPTDGVTQVIKAVESKWWLFTVEDDEGVREGIKAIMKMMLGGPPSLAAAASQMLTTVGQAQFPNGGEDYVEAYIEMLQEHGDDLLGKQKQDGSLMLLGQRVPLVRFALSLPASLHLYNFYTRQSVLVRRVSALLPCFPSQGGGRGTLCPCNLRLRPGVGQTLYLTLHSSPPSFLVVFASPFAATFAHANSHVARVCICVKRTGVKTKKGYL